MTKRRALIVAGLAVFTALSSTLLFPRSYAQQPAADVAIDADDIGGVVTGPKGPEAGVWVIAETRDLPVRYIKSVVTDDRGRFVVPDLPAASYRCGRVATDWSTAPRRPPSRDSASRSRPFWPPMRPSPPATIRPSTGTRC